MNFSGLTDSEKWSCLRKGNEEAFSFIYTEHSKTLYLYGLKLTSDKVLVEDSIHDLFTDLLRNCKNLGDTDNILFYLLKSFKRKLLRNLQKENKPDISPAYQEYDFNITYSIEHEIIIDEISKQKTYLLMKALKELTPREKEAIYLKFSRELNYREVSEIMNISIESCRNLISIAVKTMKKAIKLKDQDTFILFLSLLKNIS